MVESVSYKEYATCINRIGQWTVGNGKKFKKRDLYGYFGRAADLKTVEHALRTRFQDNVFTDDSLTAEYIECAVVDNLDLSFLPAYVTGTDGTRYYKDTYVDMANRVSAYEVLNGVSPKIVYLKKENTASASSGIVTNAFKNALGTFDGTIDGALKLIQGRGYSYYYDSKYNTQNTINRVKNRLGANCTDITQVLYRIGIENGYTVQFIHVQCSTGGHIRMRLKHPKHTGGNWIYRDGASVLKGNAINSNWCMNGRIIAYDPSWIFNDLYQ